MTPEKKVRIRVSYMLEIDAVDEDQAMYWLERQQIVPDGLQEQYVEETLAFDYWGEEPEDD